MLIDFFLTRRKLKINNEKYEVGKIYNILKAIRFFKIDGSRRLRVEVECILCGKKKIMYADALYRDVENSCMCKNRKHGMSDTKIYSVYANIKDRCYNKNNQAYKSYGEKGIGVCDEWLDKDSGFINFLEWANKSGYEEGLTIDRINPQGNYEPSNCRWITLSKNIALANKYTHRRKAENGTYYGISPLNEYYQFDNANQFAREYNLNGANIRDVANKRKKTHKGWVFGFINEI